MVEPSVIHRFVGAALIGGAMVLFGLLAAWQFLAPDVLFGVLDFNVNRMVHINAMVVWMLYGFIGAIFWLVEDESGVPLVGVRLANVTFWILTAAVTVAGQTREPDPRFPRRTPRRGHDAAVREGPERPGRGGPRGVLRGIVAVSVGGENAGGVVSCR